MESYYRRPYPYNQSVTIEELPKSPPSMLPSINKNSVLPSIGPNGAPNGYSRADTQMVPAGQSYGGDDLGPSQRHRQVESRVQLLEQSSRALFEELIRLQNEYRTALQRQQELILGERDSRRNIEQSLRASSDAVKQLNQRLQKAEERLHDERESLGTLVSHTRSVEQAVLDSQKELVSRRDGQQKRMEDLQTEVEDKSRLMEHIQRLIYDTVDEVRQIKAKVELQSNDFSMAANDLKSRSKRLEEDSRLQKMEIMRKQSESIGASEQSLHQLKGLVDARLSEVREAVLELRSRQEQEAQERRSLEQQTALKMSDLQGAVNEERSRATEIQHKLDLLQRQGELTQDSDRTRVQMTLAGISEEFNRKLSDKEMKMREDSQNKFLSLEKALAEEQSNRVRQDKDVRDESERKWDGMKRMLEEEVRSLRDLMKGDTVHQGRNKDNMGKLNDGLNLIDERLEQFKKQIERVVTAEIQQRKQQEQQYERRIDDLSQKLTTAISSLQDAIGGVSQTVTDHRRKLNDMERDRTDKSSVPVEERVGKLEKAQRTTDLTLTDALDRLINIGKSDAGNSREVNEQLKKLTQEAEALRTQRIEALDQQMEQLKQTLRGIQSNMQESEEIAAQVKLLREWQESVRPKLVEYDKLKHAPQDLLDLQKSLDTAKEELHGRIDDEATSRIRDVDNIKKELEANAGAKSANDADEAQMKKLRDDVDEALNTTRKVAESLQATKTVIETKLQNESKRLSVRIDALSAQLDPSSGAPKQPPPPESARVFVKDGGGEKSGKPSPLNKWSLYALSRWMHFKQRWLLFKPAKKPAKKGPSAAKSQKAPPTADGQVPATPSQKRAKKAAPASAADDGSVPPTPKSKAKATPKKTGTPASKASQQPPADKPASKPPPSEPDPNGSAAWGGGDDGAW